MGCLNDDDYGHWFANVHLSGRCNRSCYFCIGQHMPGVDPLDTTSAWPLPGFDDFIGACRARPIRQVCLTGSNTDPSLYSQHERFAAAVRRELPGVALALRTNGVAIGKLRAIAPLYDKASVSITSLDPELYRATMGSGSPPDLEALLRLWSDVKVNVVLCPETAGSDLLRTLRQLADAGVKRINVREPYGQPHLGDPMRGVFPPHGTTLGCPSYRVGDAVVTYWDVHFTEVSSVNLFANGRVTEEYSVTLGHDARLGRVRDQGQFVHGRQHPQWVGRAGVIASPWP